MKINRRLLLVVTCILLFDPLFCQMVILSGPEKGSYNRFTNDIVTVLGEKNSISLINLPTGGSAYNFKQLTDPKSAYKIALIQSDYLNLMEAEDKRNNTDKAGSLKVLIQLAREEIHIVAKKTSGIKHLRDLDNKKVAVGNEDQGSFATSKIIRERSKVNWTSVYFGFDQMVKELTDGTIDAFITVGSAPINILDIDPQVMNEGPVLLELDDFNGWAKYYENDTIRKSDYKWIDKDIPTFGVRTLLVVNESKLTDSDRKTVASIKSGIIQNLDLLRKQGHPKWKDVIIPDDPDFEEEKSKEPAKAVVPVASVSKDVVLYRVQIYSRNNQKNEGQISVGGKNYKPYIYYYLGAYRYTIGEFTSFSGATEFQKSCRKEGYHEAFVAAFRNDVRSIDPALFK